ncbi:hypothetical protein [Cohnella nanjingensis]|uniref:Uncharacterized protein n=1 Tax=Cohnella nanjingensis TaxID=1387779 RepID=A0A7X0VJC2_9BACL|nr:hypothetical protein [Cohnella nanjingensis]MBB6675428.1 hypothetical protein [Cohnella nanjingensis]
MTFGEKVTELKLHEALCYRICYFLLENEFDACAAAEHALLALYRDEAFWRASPDSRPELAKRAATSEALRRKSQMYASFAGA